MSPLVAQSGHPDTRNQCPLSGVKRKSLLVLRMSAPDPKRTCHLQQLGRIFEGDVGDLFMDESTEVPHAHLAMLLVVKERYLSAQVQRGGWGNQTLAVILSTC